MMYCDIQKTYKSGKRTFNLQIKASFQIHKINMLYGVSGAGKTSLLRLLSGLDTPDSGTVNLSNICWFDDVKKINIPVAQRKIAYVFQDVGLFPNMTVLQNLEFAKKDINPVLLKEVIETLETQELLKNKPTELSGGQQQRVALARAILQEPDFLFLDEPLTAIDEVLRNKLQDYIIHLQQKHQFTVIMISHYLPEVLKVADHVCEISNGKVMQQGTPSLLISKNNLNTLKAIVLEIKNSEITVVVGAQQVVTNRNNIIQQDFFVGTEIDFKINV